ncbi:MAG: tRNA epoxyqueuosine(34) reductase QueG [Chlorobiales bacterium]|nr:tRNA epoxyqueuosine(34) reductase QueG [Chlorobiales bacterium]
MNKEQLAEIILQKAQESCFCAAGFASVTSCKEESKRLLDMIRENRHGEMSYMQKELSVRNHPEKLLPGAKTVFSAALPYTFPLERVKDKARISRYALVADYHRVLRSKLGEILDFIREIHTCTVAGIVCVDSTPVFEKNWAEKAGLGATGKNTMLIVPNTGSYVFLGEILLDIELPATPSRQPDPCLKCDKCLGSCPTGALIEPGRLDARKCISYLTVELKREFTPEESAMTGEWLFGCDICQEVCPHNVLKNPAPTCPEFIPKKELLEITPEQILPLTRSQFKALFAATPVFRAGLKRLKRNARAVTENLNNKVKGQK